MSCDDQKIIRFREFVDRLAYEDAVANLKISQGDICLIISDGIIINKGNEYGSGDPVWLVY